MHKKSNKDEFFQTSSQEGAAPPAENQLRQSIKIIEED
jgi:hypothetical protein